MGGKLQDMEHHPLLLSPLWTQNSLGIPGLCQAGYKVNLELFINQNQLSACSNCSFSCSKLIIPVVWFCCNCFRLFPDGRGRGLLGIPAGNRWEFLPFGLLQERWSCSGNCFNMNFFSCSDPCSAPLSQLIDPSKNHPKTKKEKTWMERKKGFYVLE